MKLVDINVLLYAVNRRSPHHDRIRKWWEEALVADEPVGLAWIVLTGFLRLATRPGVLERPLSVEEAIAIVDDWFRQPNVRLVVEDTEHWTRFRELLQQTGTAGNLTNDAHLASIALATGATLVSGDTDFARFQQLRWKNPLSV